MAITNRNRLLEKYVQVVRMDGLNTNKNVNIGINGATPSLSVAGATTLSGTITTGGLVQGTVQTLASAATVAFTPTSTVVTHTPSQSETINFATPPQAGTGLYLEVVTSGTSSFTLTFGTNTKTTGTLATGTVSAKTFMINFVSDGTNWLEVARTTAM